MPIELSWVEIGLIATIVLLLVAVVAIFVVQSHSKAMFRSTVELAGRLSQMSSIIHMNKANFLRRLTARNYPC